MPISTVSQKGLDAPLSLTAPVISTITNGAATLTLPTTTGTVALTNQVIGVGQTWQNVAKFSGVTYTNNTGKPIFISVNCNLNSSTISLTVDGLVIQSMGNTAAGPGNVSALIPNNSTYSVSAPSAVSWFELS